MGGAVFVSTALLKLANEDAGCFEDTDDCQGRVYGMRPSSLLTNIVTVIGLISAVSMPLVGSVIDHTKYRRHVGRWSAVVMTGFILLQALLLTRSWFGAAIVQVFIAFTYTVHLCASYAYLPELTSDADQLVYYSSRFVAAQYGSSVMFLVVMVLLLEISGIRGVLEAAHISQSVVIITCVLFFGYSWSRLFPDRPARQQVEAGDSIFTAGFNKIFHTSKNILRHHSAMKWFLISVAFTEAAATAFSPMAITFMTDHLQFTAAENGTAILLLLLFGVPGTKIATFFTNLLNPIRSLQLCLIVWITSTALASWFLHGQDAQIKAYCFAVVWGLAFGWVYPTEKVLYCTIIPKGQEAELMGVYICACQILSWLPPLVFSIMNEAGVPMQLGLLTLISYFLVSFTILFFVGDYDDAVAHAKAQDETSLIVEKDGKKCAIAVNPDYQRFTNASDEEQDGKETVPR